MKKAHRIRDGLREVDLANGRQAEIVGYEPLSFTSDQKKEMVQACLACHVFLSTVAAAIRHQDQVGTEIGNLLKIRPERLSLMRADLQGQDAVPMVRPDVMWDENDQITAVEVETFIGGLGMLPTIMKLFDLPTSGDLPQAYAKMMAQQYDAFMTGTGRSAKSETLTIAIINPAQKALYDREFDLLREAQRKIAGGLNVIVARPDEVSVIKGKVVALGEEVDMIHRFFRVSELAEHYPDQLEMFMTIATEKLVCVVQPWLEILEEKALYAFLHRADLEEYWRETLGDEHYSFLKNLFPKTWIVSPEFAKTELYEATYNGARSARPYWLKRSGETWGGHHAIQGKGIGTAKWQQALKQALAEFADGRPWILQEERVCSQRSMPHLEVESDNLLEKGMNLRVSPFAFLVDGKIDVVSILVTGSRSAKVHGSRNALMVPGVIH